MTRDTYRRYADAGAAGSVVHGRKPLPARRNLAEGTPPPEAEPAIIEDRSARSDRPRQRLREMLVAAELRPENLSALKAAAIILAIIAFILLLHG